MRLGFFPHPTPLSSCWGGTKKTKEKCSKLICGYLRFLWWPLTSRQGNRAPVRIHRKQQTLIADVGLRDQRDARANLWHWATHLGSLLASQLLPPSRFFKVHFRKRRSSDAGQLFLPPLPLFFLFRTDRGKKNSKTFTPKLTPNSRTGTVHFHHKKSIHFRPGGIAAYRKVTQSGRDDTITGHTTTEERFRSKRPAEHSKMDDDRRLCCDGRRSVSSSRSTTPSSIWLCLRPCACVCW